MGAIPWPARGGAVPEQGREVVLGVRPDDLSVADGTLEGAFQLQARVSVVEPLGPDALVYADVNGSEVVAKAGGRQPPEVGTMVSLRAPADELHVFDAETEKAPA